jgi:type I restriction enzyme R subunit
MQAQQRVAGEAERTEFAEQFLRCEGLFEFLWPDLALRPIEDDYRWLAKIYKSIAPTGVADKLLWHRLGAKTQELIAEYVTGVEVDPSGLEEIAVDAGVFEALRDLKLFPDPIYAARRRLPRCSTRSRIG